MGITREPAALFINYIHFAAMLEMSAKASICKITRACVFISKKSRA